MTSQVCIRCRKRRIRCDREMPACKNCRLADVDCMLFDDSLGEEIPCSYLHSLEQQVQSLQLELQQTTDRGNTASSLAAYHEGAVTRTSRQGYHVEVAGSDELPSPSRTAYLGPESSARLVQGFLTRTAKWYTSNGVQISRCLLPRDGPSRQSASHDTRGILSFPPTNNDLRKVELHSLVPPSTQRTIIEYYLHIVMPEYPLLPIGQVAALLSHENPLKWTGINKADVRMALTIAIVFAVSTALITRDLDSHLATVCARSRDDVQRLSLEDTDQPGTSHMSCTALCALALIELICPTSGQLWDLLGRAASVLEDLQEARSSSHSDPDPDLSNLERVLLKLESMAARHFGRPSLLLDTQLQRHLEEDVQQNVLSDELHIASCLRRISRTLQTTVPFPSEALLEALIPLPLQVTSPSLEINLSSATLYIALHPLFTDADKHDADPSSGGGIHGTASLRIIQLISKSACVVIDDFVRLNERNMIVSIWFAAERVLEAGTVWAASLVHQRHIIDPRLQLLPTRGDPSEALRPVIKVSNLLASFSARWKPGLAYVHVWEAVVELLWKVV